VRNKAATDKRVAEELSERSNITILEADLTNYDSLKVCLSISVYTMLFIADVTFVESRCGRCHC
jgi:hypothetical protein